MIVSTNSTGPPLKDFDPHEQSPDLQSSQTRWPFDRVSVMELNHLAAILHVYDGGLIFMKLSKKILFFKKKGKYFLVKSLQKEQNSTNLLKVS
jgi:hypothetical protein